MNVDESTFVNVYQYSHNITKVNVDGVVTDVCTAFGLLTPLCAGGCVYINCAGGLRCKFQTAGIHSQKGEKHDIYESGTNVFQITRRI